MIELMTGVLLIASGAFVLISAIGFVSPREFFVRMHPPAVAYTLGCWSATAAGILSYAVAGPVVVLLAINVPVTSLLLARVTLFRQRHRGGTTSTSQVA